MVKFGNHARFQKDPIENLPRHGKQTHQNCVRPPDSLASFPLQAQTQTPHTAPHWSLPPPSAAPRRRLQSPPLSARALASAPPRLRGGAFKWSQEAGPRSSPSSASPGSPPSCPSPPPRCRSPRPSAAGSSTSCSALSPPGARPSGPPPRPRPRR